ncbi:unnamed protein product [Diamesa serratosioi]
MNIREFYSGKNIFITGATGFIGKVLVWKFLKDCNVNKVYILVRTKRDVVAQMRLKAYLSHMMFDEFRLNDPSQLEKICVVTGDISVDKLGLNEYDENLLIKDVHAVFHCAASVRFDYPLKTAVNLNTTGTLRMLQLAEKMKNLQIFTYMSTAFCQKMEMEEKYYPAFADPIHVIELTNILSEEALAELTKDFLSRGYPNTYALTKALAEELIHSYRNKFPTNIIRPSIVMAAYQEPFPGWIEGLSGATGIFVGISKGIIRSTCYAINYTIKYVPVDILVNATIASAVKRTTMNSNNTFYTTCSDTITNAMTFDFFTNKMIENTYKYPLTSIVWYPTKTNFEITSHHKLSLIFMHFLPALLIDCSLRITGKKMTMVNLHKKISGLMDGFRHFTSNNFDFKTENFQQMEEELNVRDKKKFFCNMNKIPLLPYIEGYSLGIREFVMNDKMETLPEARAKLLRLLTSFYTGHN